MSVALLELPMSIPRIHEVLPEFRDCPPLPPSSYPPSSDWSAPLSARHSPCPVQPPISIFEYNRETTGSPTQHNPFLTYSGPQANQYILHPSQHDASSAQQKTQHQPAYLNSIDHRDFGRIQALSPPGMATSSLLPFISTHRAEYLHSRLTEPQSQAYNHRGELKSPTSPYSIISDQPRREFHVNQGPSILNSEGTDSSSRSVPSGQSRNREAKIEQSEERGPVSNTNTTPNEASTSTPNIQRRGRRSNLPRQVTNILQEWLREHSNQPYPTVEEKQMLMKMTSLSLSQISNWFINARRRRLNNIASYRHVGRSSSSGATDEKKLTNGNVLYSTNQPDRSVDQDTVMKGIMEDTAERRISDDGESG